MFHNNGLDKNRHTDGKNTTWYSSDMAGNIKPHFKIVCCSLGLVFVDNEHFAVFLECNFMVNGITMNYDSFGVI